MSVSDFEDPRDLLRCIQSDCTRAQAGGSPFCAQHLREQEIKSPGIVEPDLEAKVAKVRTEDDDHPGMVKVYDKETGQASWVPKEPDRLYVGPDPDVNGIAHDEGQVVEALRLDVPTWNQRVGIDPPDRPDPSTMEPHWDQFTRQWVLRPRQRDVDLEAVRSLVRELMHELGIEERERDDHA